MKITSSGIINGKIQDKYGKFGSEEYKGFNILSLPFKIEDAPKNTKCFAVVLDDKDAIEVCGFTWIHWLIADLTDCDVCEDASRKSQIVQGVTSAHSKISPLTKEEASRYIGMAPPDKPHRYDLTVYALNEFTGLKNGFTYNNLWYSMKDHIIDSATITGIYNS